MFGGFRFVGVLLFCLLVIGCGDNLSTVVGEANYDDKPIENGSVTLLPADGKGPASEGKITDGKFKVEKVTPGEKIVLIQAFKKIDLVTSSEEAAAQAKANKGKKLKPETTELIPVNAVGSKGKITVGIGTQTEKFDLKPPKKK